MPKPRLGITEKIAGGTNTKKNVWPFVVSWFLINDLCAFVVVKYLIALSHLIHLFIGSPEKSWWHILCRNFD
jgi:hypothetical protein